MTARWDRLRTCARLTNRKLRKGGRFCGNQNSVIGDGTKISHLTYVGDNDVGGGVNFGCGTVTVNYDGIKKHRTVIGDNVFIGCNTNLVAPVTVGDNAFIAAGSTITEEIPPKALLLQGKDRLKENYVAQKMPDMIKSDNLLGGIFMCGIIGYTGDRYAPEILIQGLKKLEYRGYDSAGIAVSRGGETLICKKTRKGRGA